jgi:TetR/AcrR family transcriptional regulator
MTSQPATDSTATTILDAAEELFARQGYAATSVKQIGTAAGVNPALLYYYFGDKDGLYRAALARVFGTIGLNVGERVALPGPPADALRAILRFQAHFFATRPHAARLLMREIVDHEARHAADDVAHFARSTFTRLCDVIRAGQASGHFRADLRPEFAAFSTVGQMVYFALVQPVASQILRLGRHSCLGPSCARPFRPHRTLPHRPSVARC